MTKLTTNVFCLGDSNIDTWRLIQRNKPIEGFTFTTTSIFGCTSAGINNLESQSQSLLKFRKGISENIQSDYCIFGMGENDTGKMIWLLAERDDTDPKKIVQDSILEQKKFLQNELVGLFESKQIIVQSCPMPTVKDPTKTNLRKNVTSSWEERIEHTHYFNDCLKEMCDSLGVNYLDTTTPTINQDTKEIDIQYINKWWDHHIKKEKAIELFRQSFLEFIKKNG